MPIKKQEAIMKMKKAGCRKDIIEALSQLSDESNKVGILHTFKEYREKLQESMDDECKSIDCIDYLIYEIEKKQGG